jgi:hypothetical protein
MSLAEISEYVRAFFRGLGDLGIAIWHYPIPFTAIFAIGACLGVAVFLLYLIYQWYRQIYLAVQAWRGPKRPSE